MTTEHEVMDPRRKARYEATAKRLGIVFIEYLEKGSQGLRFCSKCLKWKRRSSFLEYITTQHNFTGVCKSCRHKRRKPKGVEGRYWGPAIIASRRLGIKPEEYVKKRAEGLRWCTAHRDWFDANPILNSTRYQGGNIIRCRPCQKALRKSIKDVAV